MNSAVTLLQGEGGCSSVNGVRAVARIAPVVSPLKIANVIMLPTHTATHTQQTIE